MKQERGREERDTNQSMRALAWAWLAAVDEKCVASSCAAIIIVAKSKPHLTHARTHARRRRSRHLLWGRTPHARLLRLLLLATSFSSICVQTLISFSLSLSLCGDPWVLPVSDPYRSDLLLGIWCELDNTHLAESSVGDAHGGKKNSAAHVEEEDSHGCEWYRRSWNPTLYFPCKLARSIAPGTFSTNSKLAAIAAKSSRPTCLPKKELCLLACGREGGREGVCSGVCVRRLWRIGSAAAEEEEAAFEVGKKCGSSMHWQDP